MFALFAFSDRQRTFYSYDLDRFTLHFVQVNGESENLTSFHRIFFSLVVFTLHGRTARHRAGSEVKLKRGTQPHEDLSRLFCESLYISKTDHTHHPHHPQRPVTQPTHTQQSYFPPAHCRKHALLRKAAKYIFWPWTLTCHFSVLLSQNCLN